MFVTDGVVLGLFFYSRTGAFLLILILSIFAAATRIIRCASNEKIATATMWTAALILFVGGFVFVAGLLRLLPQPSSHWLP